MTNRLFERRFTLAHPSYTNREVIKIIIILFLHDINANRRISHAHYLLDDRKLSNTQLFKL